MGIYLTFLSARKNLLWWFIPFLLFSFFLGTVIEQEHLENTWQNFDENIYRTYDQKEIWVEGTVVKQKFFGDKQQLILKIDKLGETSMLHHLPRPLLVLWQSKKTSNKEQSSVIKPIYYYHSDRITLKGNLRWFQGHHTTLTKEYQAFWQRRGVVWKFVGDIFLKKQSQQWRLSEYLQKMIRDQLDRFDRSDGVDLVKGIVLGEAGALKENILRSFRKLGLGHLLAVSGLHIGICAVLFAWLFARLACGLGSSFPYLWRLSGLVLGAWLYTSLASFPLSGQRAALMLSFWAASQLMFHSLKSLECLWLTAWTISFSFPSVAQEMGFQLSLMATWGLCSSLQSWHCHEAFQHRKQKELKKRGQQSNLVAALSYLKRGLHLSARISIVSWLFTLPIFVWHLGEINVFSILYNTFLTPLLSLTFIPCALVASLLTPISTIPLGWMVDWGDLICAYLGNEQQLVEFQWIVGSSFTVITIFILLSWFYWVQSFSFCPSYQSLQLLFTSQVLREWHPLNITVLVKQHRYLQGLSLLCLLLSLLFLGKEMDDHRFQKPQVTFIYIGQGDCTLISNGDGGYALFDVGPEYSARALLKNLKRRGITTLDWVMLSHLHPDHYGGLLRLIDEIEVKKVIYHGRPPQTHPTKKEEHSWVIYQVALHKRQIPLLRALPGKKRWGHLTLQQLLTDPSPQLSENDASLALLVDGQAKRLLLSGDLEQEGEARLRSVWVKEKLETKPLNIWQINHHGSATSTKPATVVLLQPQEAVLSLDGLHRFHFPHPQTVSTLNGYGVKQSRLDLLGDYAIEL